MNVYLVGGAVRDQLLNYPIKEKDWVVVGATPEEMLARGFQKVGKDFPVFLHPQTHEEYALARTERKKGRGYYGFVCDFSPKVSLEEDLKRRDLTINAMARDDAGNLIDPYNGKIDLENKILRHVSPAFVEDPVRVLRVARFAARYYHLGFRLAAETKSLMYSMVKNGELLNLVAERVWQEWQLSLEEKNPEQFIVTLRACGALKIIIPELDNLFGVPNNCKYHFEIDSGIHSLYVLSEAGKLSADPTILFAAVVHDLGKAVTHIEKWPSHHGHEDLGLPLITALCERLRIPKEYKQLALMASKYHLKIHKINELKPSTIVKLLEECDAFRRRNIFEKLLIIAEADARGKGQDIDYPQAKLWLAVLDECLKVNAQDSINQGYSGIGIREHLHRLRVKQVATFLKRENNEK